MSKSLSGNANANLNVTDLMTFLREVGDTGQNDLGIQFDNRTDYNFKINYEVLHGRFDQFIGTSDLQPYIPGESHNKEHMYDMAFQGAGSYGVQVIINISNQTHGGKYYMMIGTPDNKKTYIRGVANDAKGTRKISKHRSNKGIVTYKYDKFKFEVTLTNASPSECHIMILPN